MAATEERPLCGSIKKVKKIELSNKHSWEPESCGHNPDDHIPDDETEQIISQLEALEHM